MGGWGRREQNTVNKTKVNNPATEEKKRKNGQSQQQQKVQVNPCFALKKMIIFFNKTSRVSAVDFFISTCKYSKVCSTNATNPQFQQQNIYIYIYLHSCHFQTSFTAL